MREIKFRAWDYNNECIVPWEKLRIEKDEGENTFSVVVFDGDVGDYFDDFPVMQYTGLTDKNGKEIYEGDVVKTHNQNNVVEYEQGTFRIKGLHPDEYERTYTAISYYLIDSTIPTLPHSRYDGITTTLEVVGNIYVNPELLEVNHD